MLHSEPDWPEVVPCAPGVTQARLRLRAVGPRAPVFPALSHAPEAAWQAQPVVSAHWVQALPRGEPAAQHVAAEVRRALPGAAQAPRREEVAARDAGQPAAVAALAGAGERREVPGAVVGRGLPSAVVWALLWAWAFRRDQALLWPAP